MSRNSDAKKARRKKRQAVRNSRWPSGGQLQQEQHDPALIEAVSTFEDWITERGWTFDLDFSGKGLASWYYEPSAAESGDGVQDDGVQDDGVQDDGVHEVVTRVWFTVGENREQDFPNRVNAVLVGSGGSAGNVTGAVYAVTPDQLIDQIEAIENYRPGDAVPILS